MDEAKQQIVERLKEANNVLVTVSRDPSVDQLAAAIGLALFLNKLNKHASAVFSGRIPPVLEFLQPEKTLEKNTDSLRDFIIALDKSKADKLRYKVEDEHVKIFITPYRTSITQEDLEFSQGDFNVDVVIALGVQEQKDLDQAITVHGRILHDATVISISKQQGASVGTMNWVKADASSLCEMVEEVIDLVKTNSLDGQMATALLTGIVAETARFSNEKTTSVTMSVSAKLLEAGANQQLVAENLQPKPAPPPPPPPEPPKPPAEPWHAPVEGAPDEKPEEKQSIVDAAAGQSAPVASDPGSMVIPEGGLSLPPVQPPEEQKPSDGALYISHEPEAPEEPEEEPEEEKLEQIHIDEQGELRPIQQDAPALPTVPPAEQASATDSQPSSDLPKISEPASALGDRHLLGNDDRKDNTFGISTVDDSTPAFDPMGFVTGDSLPKDNYSQPVDPMLEPSTPPPSEAGGPVETPAETLGGTSQTLSDLEQSVSSPHVQDDTTPQLSVPSPYSAPDATDAARNAVDNAMNGTASPLPPITALNAQPLNIGLPGDQPLGMPSMAASAAPVGVEPSALPVQAAPAADEPLTSDFSFPNHLIEPTDPGAGAASTAPPVPPPMMPNMGAFPPLPGTSNPSAPASGSPFPPRAQPPAGY